MKIFIETEDQGVIEDKGQSYTKTWKRKSEWAQIKLLNIWISKVGWNKNSD